jgi:hypothetical protein
LPIRLRLQLRHGISSRVQRSPVNHRPVADHNLALLEVRVGPLHAFKLSSRLLEKRSPTRIVAGWLTSIFASLAAPRRWYSDARRSRVSFRLQLRFG